MEGFYVMKYNIHAELSNNLEEFYSSTVKLVRQFGDEYNGEVDYSQWQTLRAIDLALNSKFSRGQYDTEGQRKLYLNIVRFIRDVARMRTDIDVKNYVFNPDTYNDIWSTYFMARKFKLWAREENYGELINRIGDDFATYGTAVLKKVKSGVKRVPIGKLINSQRGESLNEIAKTGGYVIEPHEMTLGEMKEFPAWNTEGLEDGKKYMVYERYSLVPRGIIDDTDDEERVLAMQILIPEKEEKKDDGKLVYIQEVKDTPYEDVFWEKVDGRWLGRGPVEQQLENQIAKNTIFNLRRRSLLWATKKIYQSQSDEVQKNLVKDVRDGQVLNVGPNGTISPIPTESRALADYQSLDNVVDNNSKQTSFTFEVATGETMPSGTPFRLGAILSTAVDSFYGLKREQFGLFLKRSFFSQLIPTFKKQNSREHTLTIASNEEGIELLKEAMMTYHTNRRYINALLQGQIKDIPTIRQEVEEEAVKSPYFFIDIPAKYYDEAKYHMELDITDEATDTRTEVETLTNIFQVLSQKGDPRADRVLEMLISKTGRNIDVIAGKAPATQPQGQLPQGQGQLPQLNLAQNAEATV